MVSAWRPVGGGGTALDRAQETYPVTGTLKHAGLSGFQLDAGASGLTIAEVEGPDNAADFTGLALTAGQELVFGQPITLIRLSAGSGVVYNSAERQATWFVSLVNGDDNNDGFTASSQFRTINKLNTYNISAGDVVTVEDDSEWREELIVGSGVLVQRSDTGTRMPVFNASDIENNWALESGNTYSITVTVPTEAEGARNGKSLYTVYEDEILLTRVADQATVDSTPGSFAHTSAATPGSTVTIYVHPTNSDNPNNNGSVYEVSKRLFGFRGGNNVTVRGIRTKNSVDHNGSFRVRNFCDVSDCIFENGHVHNALFGSGTVRRCHAYGFDNNTPVLGVAFTSYSVEDQVGDTIYEDCTVVNKLTSITTAITGFYAHGDQAQSPNAFDRLILRRCRAFYVQSLFSTGALETGSIVSERNLAYQCNRFGANFQAPFTSDEDEYYRDIDGTVSTPVVFNEIIGGATITRFKSYLKSGYFAQYTGTGVWNFSVSNSIISKTNTSDTGFGIQIPNAATVNLNITDSIIANYSGLNRQWLNVTTNADVTATTLDRNYYSINTTRFNILGTTYQFFSSYQSGTPYAANSISSTLAGETDGETGITNISNRDYSQVENGIAETRNVGDVGAYVASSDYSALITVLNAA